MNVSKYKNSKFKSPYSVARSAFIQADIDLFENPFFQNVSDAEKVVYTILSHRMDMSMRDERFCDENGYFIFFRQKELAKKLGRSLISVKRIFKALEEHGLIVTQKRGTGLVQKIYLVNPYDIIEENNKSSVVFDDDKNPFYEENDFAQTGIKSDTSQVSKMIPAGIKNDTREVSKMIPPLYERDIQERYILRDKEIYKEKPKIESPKRKCFIKPSVEEIKSYADEKGYYNFDAERFYDYYEANGWHCGKSPMKDWKAAMRNWARNNSKWKGNYGSRYVDEDERESKETLHRQIAELEKAGYL